MIQLNNIRKVFRTEEVGTIALGGVTLDKLPYLKQLNFGGIAMIGGIYNTDILNNLPNLNSYK